MSKKIKGFFQITGWDENPLSEAEDGSKQSHANITQTYTGDIEGESEINYIMSYRADETAVFAGFEILTGHINGKSGSFILQHNGIFESGVAKSHFVIVKGSGQEDFVNISGQGEFCSSTNGQADYNLDYSIA
ncbi:MAG: DUF3224 domain-containing protein [Gammaproteobacteria bacterium]|nr:DUF3224 domain-containing protein [Gammaproteobacteria bacterium]